MNNCLEISIGSEKINFELNADNEEIIKFLKSSLGLIQLDENIIESKLFSSAVNNKRESDKAYKSFITSALKSIDENKIAGVRFSNNITSAKILSLGDSRYIIEIPSNSDTLLKDLSHELIHLLIDDAIDKDTKVASSILEIGNTILQDIEVNEKKSKFFVIEDKLKEAIDSNNIHEILPIIYDNSTIIKNLNSLFVESTNASTFLVDTLMKYFNENGIEISKTQARTLTSTKVTREEESNDLHNDNESGITVRYNKEGGENIFVPKNIYEIEYQENYDSYLKKVNEVSSKIAKEYLFKIYKNTNEKTIDDYLNKDKALEVYKNFDYYYNFPIYRNEIEGQNKVKLNNNEFNYNIDKLEQQDLVRVPFLSWNSQKKEWYVEKKNEGKSIWMPVVYSIPNAGLVKLSKPYLTKDTSDNKILGKTMTIPYKFIQGIRTLEGEFNESQIDLSIKNKDKIKKENEVIWKGYGVPKNKNVLKDKEKDTYIRFKENSILPNPKLYNLISARNFTDDSHLRELTFFKEGDNKVKEQFSEKQNSDSNEDKIYEKSLPNNDLMKQLSKGDLVRVKVKKVDPKPEESQFMHLWLPVKSVGANGIEVVRSSNYGTYMASMDDISSVAIKKSSTVRNPYFQSLEKSLETVKITSKSGETFNIKKINESNYAFIYNFMYDSRQEDGKESNLSEYNKFLEEKNLDKITVSEAKERSKNVISMIRPGDYARVKIRINNKVKTTDRKVIAVSPGKIYLLGENNQKTNTQIFSVSNSDVEVVYKLVEDDMKNLEDFEKSFKANFKSEEHINNKYLFENHIPALGLNRIYKLKKGDVIKSLSLDGKAAYYNVVRSVDEKGVTVTTTYGKEITSKNIKIETIPFDRITELGFKKSKNLIDEKKKSFKKFKYKRENKELFVFKNEENALRFINSSFNKGKFELGTKKEGNKTIYFLKKKLPNGEVYDIKGLDKYYKKFTSGKQLESIKNNIKIGNKTLAPGDLVKVGGYYNLVTQVIFNKELDFMGVRVAAGSKDGEIYFDKFINEDKIVGFAYDKNSYSFRTDDIWKGFVTDKKTTIVERNKGLQSKNTYLKSKKDDIAVLTELGDRLKKLNPDVELIFVNNQEMEDMGYENNRGFTDGNKVFINTSLASNSDMLHEYGHILMNLVKIENPELYSRLVKESLDSPLYNHFKDLYPELSEESLGEEIFLSALDNNVKEKGFPPKTMNWWQSIKNLLSDFFNSVKLGLKKLLGIADKKSNIFNNISNNTLMRMDINSLIELFGDSILNNKIEYSKVDNQYKEIKNIGINSFNMSIEQITRLKEILNQRICYS